MTKSALLRYLDEFAITVEVYGPARDKQMRLAPPPWMTREEMVDHAAKIGKYLKAHRDEIYREFVERTTGWVGSLHRANPLTVRRGNIYAAFDQLDRLGDLCQISLAAMCPYTKRTHAAPTPDSVKPWDAFLYFVGVSGCQDMKGRLPSYYLPYSEPPPGWKSPGTEWVPPADWNNTIGWTPPEETKAQRRTKQMAKLAKRFPEVFGEQIKPHVTEWVD